VSGATAAVRAVVMSVGSGASAALPGARRAVAAVPIRIVHHEAAWLFVALVALTLVLLVEAALGAVVIARRRRSASHSDAVPHETAPQETAPQETAPQETAPQETAPQETAPHATAPQRPPPPPAEPAAAVPADGDLVSTPAAGDDREARLRG
jgi:hypothetical protein